MLIREGSLSEIVQIVEKIHEFAQKETEQSLQARLNDKTCLVLVAENESELLGFKMGYELDNKKFYSWFGGVTPAARGHGVAQRLLDVQEKWALEQGYQRIKVKSRNQFPAMLRLLIKMVISLKIMRKKNPLSRAESTLLKFSKK